MKKCVYFQHGDVLLKRIEKLPKGARKIEGKVLQLGEVTNHRHQFRTTDNVEIWVDKEFAGKDLSITPDEGKFVIVGDMAYLRHEEHKTIEVPPGVYQVDIVREFSYDDMEARRVVD